MSTSRVAVKVRLDTQQLAELHELHGGYGEAQRVIRELVANYLLARRAQRSEASSIADAILRKVRVGVDDGN